MLRNRGMVSFNRFLDVGIHVGGQDSGRNTLIWPYGLGFDGTAIHVCST